MDCFGAPLLPMTVALDNFLESEGLFMIRTICLSLAAALAFSPAVAQAQEDDRPLLVTFGAGPQFLPAFPGADDYEINPLFTGGVRREGDPLNARAPDDGFGFSLTGRGGLVEIGPMIAFEGDRSSEEVGAPVGDVDFTFEPGVFVNLNVSPSFRLRVEARKGVNGHEGFVGDVGADLFLRSGTETVFSIGPRVRLADEDWMNAYFGVTPAVAVATGLPAYAPEGGISSYGAIAGLTHQFSRTLGVFAYAGYDRLSGDAAESPIVRAFGSRDQFSGGIALTFTFRMRNPF